MESKYNELTVTDFNNCLITESYTVSEPDELIINLQSTSLLNTLCFDDNNGNIHWTEVFT